MRLIDADKLYPDRMTKDGLAISQSQIANAPTVEERPHGEWISCKDDNFYKCSECKQIVMSEERSNFCPNCGAKMSANDRQVAGKLDEEPKDSHAEYWNSIGEWKEGDEK